MGAVYNGLERVRLQRHQRVSLRFGECDWEPRPVTSLCELPRNSITIRNRGHLDLERIDGTFPELLNERQNGCTGDVWFRVRADIDAFKFELRSLRTEGQFAIRQYAESAGSVVREYILIFEAGELPFLLFLKPPRA
jgi:hypothetical protein